MSETEAYIDVDPQDINREDISSKLDRVSVTTMVGTTAFVGAIGVAVASNTLRTESL